jgi:glycosyltransferase involved in cell wall biosynthesis
MKIVIDATNIRSGGGIKHLIGIHKYIKEFNTINFEIYLSDKLYKLNLKKFNNCNLIFPWWVKSKSIIRSILHLIFFYFKLKKSNPDFVIYPGSIIPFTCKNFNSICISLNVLPFYKNNNSFSIKSKILNFLYIYSYKVSDLVVFPTNASKELIEYYTGKIINSFVMPSPFESEFSEIKTSIFKKYRTNQFFKLVYVSPIFSYKNQNIIIDAINLLPSEYKNSFSIDFIGGGSGSYFKSFISKLDKLKNNQFNINYLGEVSHNYLIKNLSNYDASLFASSCEALPFTILELHENDIPLMISDVSPMKDIFDDQIIKFDPLSPVSVKSALLKLFSKDIYSYNLSNYGRTLLDMSWKKYLFNLIENCDELKK